MKAFMTRGIHTTRDDETNDVLTKGLRTGTPRQMGQLLHLRGIDIHEVKTEH